MERKTAKIYIREWTLEINNEVGPNEYVSDESFELYRKTLQEQADRGELKVTVEDVAHTQQSIYFS